MRYLVPSKHLISKAFFIVSKATKSLLKICFIWFQNSFPYSISKRCFVCDFFLKLLLECITSCCIVFVLFGALLFHFFKSSYIFDGCLTESKNTSNVFFEISFTKTTIIDHYVNSSIVFPFDYTFTV